MKTRARMLTVTSLMLSFAAVQISAQSSYTPYAFTTIAGKAGRFGSVDGTGTDARFTSLAGLAADSKGDVYVAEFELHTIRKITAAGVVTTFAGSSVDANGDGGPDGGYADGTGSEARFLYPTTVAVDIAGNVYVADNGNHTIRKVTAAGVVTTIAGKAGVSGTNNGTGYEARFAGPTGVAVDIFGNVYVADGTTIRKVTAAGVVTTLAGKAGTIGSADGAANEARFNAATSLAVDRSGNIYVADYGSYTIRKVTKAGLVTTLAGKADSFGSSDGIGSAARFGTADGGPITVAVDNAGDVLVADKFNHTIRKVTSSGVVTTLAGRARIVNNSDGTGSAAGFNGPNGIAVDPEGNVFVSDSGNYTIRKGNPENVPAVIVTSGSVFGFNGGSFRFNLTGPTGQLVVVETSPDLVSWLPLLTNTFSDVFTFSDSPIGSPVRRHFRARTP